MFTARNGMLIVPGPPTPGESGVKTAGPLLTTIFPLAPTRYQSKPVEGLAWRLTFDCLLQDGSNGFAVVHLCQDQRWRG